MTADKLPPLPEPVSAIALAVLGPKPDYFTEDQMRERDAMWLERISALTALSADGTTPGDGGHKWRLVPVDPREMVMLGEDSARELLTATNATLAAPTDGAEPVAWISKFARLSDGWTTTAYSRRAFEDMPESISNFIPLYASPPPSAELGAGTLHAAARKIADANGQPRWVSLDDGSEIAALVIRREIWNEFISALRSESGADGT